MILICTKLDINFSKSILRRLLRNNCLWKFILLTFKDSYYEITVFESFFFLTIKDGYYEIIVFERFRCLTFKDSYLIKIVFEKFLVFTFKNGYYKITVFERFLRLTFKDGYFIITVFERFFIFTFKDSFYEIIVFQCKRWHNIQKRLLANNHLWKVHTFKDDYYNNRRKNRFHFNDVLNNNGW